MTAKKNYNFVLYLVNLICIMCFSFYTLSSYAQSTSSYEQNKPSLAGFKVHTSVIKPDETAVNSEINSSTVSTNNKYVKKTIVKHIDSSTKDNFSNTKQKNEPTKKIAQIPTKTTSNIPNKQKITTQPLSKNVQKKSSNNISPFKNQDKPTINPVKSPINYKSDQNNNIKNQEESIPADEKLNLPANELIPLSENIKNPEPAKELNLGNMIFSLFIVIILILIISWIYYKLRDIGINNVLSSKFKKEINGKFNLLSSTTLGQGKSIHLVEIKGKQLVIGSTNSNINLLTEIKDSNIEKENPAQNEEYTEFFNNENPIDQFPEIYKEYLENKDE